MAKRKKKLNKKLVVSLSAVTILLLMGISYGLYRYRHIFFPKDPVSHAEAGLKALEDGKYRVAIKQLGIAVKATGIRDEKSRRQKAQYCYDLGRAYLEWLQNDKGATRSALRLRWNTCVKLMKDSATLNPEFLEPRKTLYSMYWQATMAEINARKGKKKVSWAPFLDFANSLLEIDKKNPIAYWRRGFAHSNVARGTADVEAARRGLSDLRKAIELDSDNVRFWASWLGTLEWTSARDVSIDVDAGFTEALEKNPKSALLRILYADYLRRKGRSDEAEERLREAIASEPSSPNGHLAMAKYRMVSQQYDEAMESLQAAADIDPALADIYLQRSVIYRRRKDPDNAVKALQAGVAVLEPKLSETAETQPASVRTKLLSRQVNALNSALADVALDFQQMSKDEDVKAQMVTIAKECFDKLQNLPPGAAVRHKIAGRLAILDRKPMKAIEHLEKAREIRKMSDLQIPALLVALYDSVRMPGKSQKLLLELQNAPRLRDNVDVLIALARLRMRNKDYDSAENYVNRALRAHPQHETVLRLRSELQILMGKQASSKQIGQLSKAGVRAVIEQVDLKWLDGQRKDALAMLVRFRQNLPKNLLLAEREINMRLMAGDKDSAKAILAQMLKIYPDNDNMRFQASLIDKTPDERYEMHIARIDAEVSEPFDRVWAKCGVALRAGKQTAYQQFLSEAKKLKPEDPHLTDVLFRTALMKKDWAEAEKTIQRVEGKDDLQGKTMRARMFLIRRQYDNAIGVLSSLRKTHPNSKFVLRMLGQCYLALQKYDLADDVFGVLESNDPSDANGLIGMAIVTHKLGRLDENEKYITRAYQTPAGRKHGYIKRRYLELREANATGDEIARIIQEREKFHKLGQNDPNYLNNLERLARLCEFRTRDVTRAGELYREAYEKTGRSLQWARALADFYARTDQSAKGVAVLQTGVAQAGSTQGKIAWLLLYGQYMIKYDQNQAMQAFNRAMSLDANNPLPLRHMAALYAEQKQWPKAIQHMSAYVAKRGEDILGRKTLIQYRMHGKQFDKAQSELESILNSDPTDAYALLLKATLLTLRGVPAKAIQVATMAIDKYPKFAAALSVRARAYLIMGELEMSRDDLKKARALSKSPQVAMELMSIHRRLGQDEEALLVLKSVVAEHTANSQALFELVKTYISKKDWNNAELRLADAYRRFPKNVNYLILEAEMWQIRKQPENSVTVLKRAMAIDKDELEVVRAYMLALAEAKKFDDIMTVASAYKSKEPWRVWLDAIVARALAKKKLNDKADELFVATVDEASRVELPFVVGQMASAYGLEIAIERMLKVSSKRPDDINIKDLIGNLCGAVVNDRKTKLTAAKRKQYLQLAIANYTQCIAKAKTPAGIALLSNKLGKTYYDIGDPANAEKSYLKCLEIRPDDTAALNNLAYLYVDDFNEPKKALPYVRKVIRLLPQDPNVLDTYGWVMGKLKRYADAKKYLQQSIGRNPELAACRYHLGWVYEQTQDKSQAIKHYSLGLELVRSTPHHPLYKRFRNALARLGAI